MAARHRCDTIAAVPSTQASCALGSSCAFCLWHCCKFYEFTPAITRQFVGIKASKYHKCQYLTHHGHAPLSNASCFLFLHPSCVTLQVVNILKGAILSADRVTTVSESYAWEITQVEHGVGLHSILRASMGRLCGIVNGMDRLTWNPETDPYIPDWFSPADMSGKLACKDALRRELGLPFADYGVDVPLVGFVGRLDPQKGPDIIMEALSGLMALDCQVWPRRTTGLGLRLPLALCLGLWRPAQHEWPVINLVA
jgi:glycosyltransferase involved in cell wall biosynthesis